MKFEMAAIDASQSRESRPAAAGPGTGRRPTPLAARLNFTLWIATGFDLPIKSAGPRESHKSNLLQITVNE
jgi:hypothetical protein